MIARVKVDKKRFDAAIKKLPSTFAGAIQRSVARSSFAFEAAFAKEKLSGPGPASLGRRTGLLARSLSHVIDVAGRIIRAAIGFAGVKYAAIHETGGVISAVRGRFLSIPVGPALTAAGVGRFPGGPRTVPGLHFVGGFAGGALKDKDGTTFFVLKPRVRIPPRLGFFPAFSAYFGPRGPAQTALRAEAIKAAKLDGWRTR